MTEAIVNLINLVAKEVDLYEKMLLLVEKTQQALLNNNLEELTKMLDSQQFLIVQAARLEEKRRQEQDQVARDYNLAGEDMNLTQIITRAPENPAGKLQKLQQTLQALVDKINVVNGRNEGLIKDSLKYIDFAMELFAGNGTESKTYDNKPGGPGKKERGKSKLLDKRV